LELSVFWGQHTQESCWFS